MYIYIIQRRSQGKGKEGIAPPQGNQINLACVIHFFDIKHYAEGSRAIIDMYNVYIYHTKE